MFKRQLVVETKFINPNKKQQESTPTTVTPEPTPSWIEKIQRKDISRAAVGAVGLYTSVKLVNTLCTIAINYAPKN